MNDTDELFDFTDLDSIVLPGPTEEHLEWFASNCLANKASLPPDLDCMILEHDHVTFLNQEGRNLRVPMAFRLACTVLAHNVQREVWFEREELELVSSKIAQARIANDGSSDT